MTQFEMFPTATSSQRDIPANRSASQVSAKERKMIGTSGRTSAELLHKNDPLGAFSKMFMATSQWGSTKCCLTWKPKATPQGRLLFQLAVSMPRTKETDCGSSPEMWATPTASSGEPPKKTEGWTWTGLYWINDKGEKKQTRLKDQVAMWPTPTANEDAAGTPNGKMQRQLGNHPAIRGTTPEEWKRGTLNPNWVEWLMGYPIGHTVLKD